MQLGELQHQIGRFNRRGVELLAISVDEPEASLAIIDRLGLTFPLASDPEQKVIQAFRIQNPDTKELAIHAVYLLDQDGVIFYRKVGLRRPLSRELIDAIDAHRGEYPRTGEVIAPRRSISVAYPHNEFQALLAATAVTTLSANIDAGALDSVAELVRAGRLDDAQIAYKKLLRASPSAGRRDLLDSAAWLTRMLFLADHPAAMETGELLAWRLGRISELEQALQNVPDGEQKEELEQTLARARAGLSMTRATIRQQSGTWQLRRAKTALRGYREVALAELRLREADD